MTIETMIGIGFCTLIIGIVWHFIKPQKPNPHGKVFTPEQCTDPLCVASRRAILTGGHPETNQAILSASKPMAADIIQGSNRHAPIVRSTDTGTTNTMDHTYTTSHHVYAPGKNEMGFADAMAAHGITLGFPAADPLQGNAVGLQSPQQLQDYNAEVFDLGNGVSVVNNAKSNGGKMK